MPEHWMYDSPWTPPTPDKSRDAPPTLEAHEIWALQMTPLVEVCKQRGLCTHVLPYDMRTRLQALEVSCLRLAVNGYSPQVWPTSTKGMAGPL